MLMEACLSRRTTSIYNRYIRRYLDFAEHSTLTAFRLDSLKEFLAQIHIDGISHSTMLSYISALKKHCRRWDIKNDIDAQQIKDILKGVFNLSKNKKTNYAKLITVNELCKLCASANACYGRYESAMVNAMFSMAFFGFFRVSEYSATEANHTITVNDCKIVNGSLQVTIRSSKFGHNQVTIKLRPVKNKSIICPVKSYRRYMQLRPEVKSEFLFIRSDRKAVEAEDVNRYLRTLCRIAHISKKTSHAFRVGGASWAATAGWPDSVIRAHGRWSSDAFLGYIRPV